MEQVRARFLDDLAIAFHDAVYETGRSDNEARSAELLAVHAGPAVGTARVQGAGAMIRATAMREASADPATRLLLVPVQAPVPDPFRTLASTIGRPQDRHGRARAAISR